MKRFSFVVFAFALSALAAGCASTADTYYPSAAPAVLIGPNPDAPRMENSDAAGVLSVPGVHSAPLVTPAVVTPAPVVIVPETPAVVVPKP